MTGNSVNGDAMSTPTSMALRRATADVRAHVRGHQLMDLPKRSRCDLAYVASGAWSPRPLPTWNSEIEADT
jgi:hypothetical protein